MRRKLKELVMMQECLSPIPKSLMSIEQICSSFISLTCPIWSRKNSIREKTFYKCMGKVFLLKKKKASSETQGQVVGSFERHRDESFQALIASFLRTQLTAPESPGWKKRKTSDFSFNTVFFLSDERPNLDIYFDQKRWRICWFEVSGNLSFQSIFCQLFCPAAWEAFVRPKQPVNSENGQERERKRNVFI